MRSACEIRVRVEGKGGVGVLFGTLLEGTHRWCGSGYEGEI